MADKSPFNRERAQFNLIRNHKRRGAHAVVAAPNTGRGADRSVVLVGSAASGWFQAVKCWHGNHAERAAGYAAAYNAAPVKDVAHA